MMLREFRSVCPNCHEYVTTTEIHLYYPDKPCTRIVNLKEPKMNHPTKEDRIANDLIKIVKQRLGRPIPENIIEGIRHDFEVYLRIVDRKIE